MHNDNKIIFDSWRPWTVTDYDNYRLYLELCKEREKFINSLGTKRSCDWAIERKLLEAGGVGDTVYIHVPRGGGRRESIEQYFKLIESGRDVKVVNAKDIFVKPNRSYGPYDHDLWDHLDLNIQQRLYQELLRQEILKSIETLKIEPRDDDVHNHYLFNDYTYGVTLPNAFAVIKTPDSILD